VKGFGIGCCKASGQAASANAELTAKTNDASTRADTFVVTPNNGLGRSLAIQRLGFFRVVQLELPRESVP
jgi:hypothetical protein